MPSGIHRGQFKFDVISDTEVSGYFAFFNVTIPKNLMRYDTPSQWRVVLNDVEQGTQVVWENSTHTTISLFMYKDYQPVQTVKPQSTNVGPPSPPPSVGGASIALIKETLKSASYIGLLSVIVAIVALPKTMIKRLHKKQNNKQQ